MSTTVYDVFLAAMVLIDYVDENGLIQNNKTVNSFLKKCPNLLDIGQRELLLDLEFLKEKVIDCANENAYSEDGKQKRIALPKDLLSIEIIEIISDENLLFCEIGSIGKGYINLPNWWTGKIRLTYKASAAGLTNQTSVFSLDDNAVMLTMPYFLAGNLLLDENPSKANYYLSLYNENKIRLKSIVSYKIMETIEEIY